MLVWLPLAACSAVWRAVLNARGRVALAVSVQLAPPLFTIAFLSFGGRAWGVAVLSAAVVIGAVIEFAALAIAVRRLGCSLTPGWAGWTTEARAVWAQYLPLVAGTFSVAGCVLVDQAVAAALGPGNVSALSYAIKTSTVLVAVGGAGMATAVLPEFSRLVSEQRWDRLRRTLRTHIGVSMLVIVPVTAVLIGWSAGLVRVLFQRGAFSLQDAVVVAGIQNWYLLQVPFAICLLIVQRLATALSATGLVLQAGLAAMVCNIAGDLLLPRWWGVAGISLASCIGHAVFLLVLTGLLCRRFPRVLL
jgi:putative peptidoglycan lipid II flippase